MFLNIILFSGLDSEVYKGWQLAIDRRYNQTLQAHKVFTLGQWICVGGKCVQIWSCWRPACTFSVMSFSIPSKYANGLNVDQEGITSLSPPPSVGYHHSGCASLNHPGNLRMVEVVAFPMHPTTEIITSTKNAGGCGHQTQSISSIGAGPHNLLCPARTSMPTRLQGKGCEKNLSKNIRYYCCSHCKFWSSLHKTCPGSRHRDQVRVQSQKRQSSVTSIHRNRHINERTCCLKSSSQN